MEMILEGVEEKEAIGVTEKIEKAEEVAVETVGMG